MVPISRLLFFLLSLLRKLGINLGAAGLAAHVHPYTETERCFLKGPHQRTSTSVTSGQLGQRLSSDLLRAHLEGV